MGARDLLTSYYEEQKSQSEFSNKEIEIWEKFAKEKASQVANISQTQGFIAIRDHRQQEVEACQQRLRTMKSEDFRAVQAKLDISMRFLDRLNAMLNLPS